MTFIDRIDLLLAILTVIVQILTVLIIASFLFRKKLLVIYSFFLRRSSLITFIVALVSTVGSLFYSEIANFNPCILCWYQRIFMYPQVILLGIAHARNDKNISIYSFILSVIGGALALYHYLLQRGTVGEMVPCSAVGYSVSCAEYFSMQLGYVTIPLMAFSAFSLIAVLQFIKIKENSRKKK